MVESTAVVKKKHGDFEVIEGVVKRFTVMPPTETIKSLDAAVKVIGTVGNRPNPPSIANLWLTGAGLSQTDLDVMCGHGRLRFDLTELFYEMLARAVDRIRAGDVSGARKLQDVLELVHKIGFDLGMYVKEIRLR